MKRLFGKAIIASLIVSSSIGIAANANVPDNMLPVYTSGNNVDVTTSGANMNIKVNGGANGVGTANYSSFHIGKDASVNVQFTAKNQTSLNYVDAAGGMSQIYGKFTNSGNSGTGKVVLVNPNGIFFGNGANVNLNSFTATTMNATYDKSSNTLKLTKNANANKDYGIVVDSGATIKGANGVAFASNNIDVYNGSQISSASGNVKLVTSDGVNFTYKDGSLDKASNIKSSTDKMMLYVAGDGKKTTIEGKNIDLYNASTNANSQINMKGAVLKAVGGQLTDDGNIVLTSNNKVVTENTKFTTDINDKNVSYNVASGFVAPDNQQVKINAKNNISLNKNTIESFGNVTLKSTKGNVNVHNSTVKTLNGDNVTIDAGNVASIQTNSTVQASNVTVKGGQRGQVVGSKVTASYDINITSDKGLAWTKDATLTSTSNNINIKSNQNGVLLQNTKFKTSYGDINVQAAKDIKSSDLTGSTFTTTNGSQYDGDISIKTSGNLDLNDLSQFKPANNLNLGAEGNLTVSKTGSLDIKNTNFEASNITLKATKDLTIDGNTTNFEIGMPCYGSSCSVATDISGKVTLDAGQNVKTTGELKINSSDTKADNRVSYRIGANLDINAGQDVNVKLAKNNSLNGVSATAGKNMTLSTEGNLNIGNLKSGKDMTLTAKNVYQASGGMISLYKYNSTNKSELPNIEVGGTFTSQAPNGAVGSKNYEIVSSKTPTSDGKYNTEHIIKYGNSNFYLKNKLQKSTTQQVTPPNIKPRDLGGEA